MVASYSAVFAIVVGLAMIGEWTRLYLSRQIPELKDEPIRISFHIAAELVTAGCLISGGVGLWIDSGWGRSLYLVAMGMLFYTAILSPGYFAQQGNWKWPGFFLMLVVLGLAGVLLVA